MKAKFLRIIIEYLYKRYPYLVRDVVIPRNYHLHRDPRKKIVAVVNFPQPGVSGVDE